MEHGQIVVHDSPDSRGCRIGHVRTRNHQDHATRAMQFEHVLESAPFAWASLPFNLPVVTVSYSGRIFSHHLYMIVAKTDLVFPFSL